MEMLLKRNPKCELETDHITSKASNYDQKVYCSTGHQYFRVTMALCDNKMLNESENEIFLQVEDNL